MLNCSYTFEKYSVALPYKEGDDTKTGLVAKETRALRTRSHGSSQNVECHTRRTPMPHCMDMLDRLGCQPPNRYICKATCSATLLLLYQLLNFIIDIPESYYYADSHASCVFVLVSEYLAGKYSGKMKQPILEKTRQAMLPLLTEEYELYEWIKERFSIQEKSIL